MTEAYWKHRSNLNKIDDKLKEMSKQILIVKNDLSVLTHKCHIYQYLQRKTQFSSIQALRRNT